MTLVITLLAGEEAQQRFDPLKHQKAYVPPAITNPRRRF